MNRIFRVMWNAVKGCYAAVSEAAGTSQARGKAGAAILSAALAASLTPAAASGQETLTVEYINERIDAGQTELNYSLVLENNSAGKTLIFGVNDKNKDANVPADPQNAGWIPISKEHMVSLRGIAGAEGGIYVNGDAQLTLTGGLPDSELVIADGPGRCGLGASLGERVARKIVPERALYGRFRGPIVQASDQRRTWLWLMEVPFIRILKLKK